MKDITIREAQALHAKGYAIILASGEVLRIEREENADRKRDFSGSGMGSGKKRVGKLRAEYKRLADATASKLYQALRKHIVG